MIFSKPLIKKSLSFSNSVATPNEMYSYLDNGVYCSIEIGDVKYNNLRIWQVVYSKYDKNKINVMFNFPKTKNTYAQLLWENNVFISFTINKKLMKKPPVMDEDIARKLNPDFPYVRSDGQSYYEKIYNYYEDGSDKIIGWDGTKTIKHPEIEVKLEFNETLPWYTILFSNCAVQMSCSGLYSGIYPHKLDKSDTHWGHFRDMIVDTKNDWTVWDKYYTFGHLHGGKHIGISMISR